MEMDNHMSDKDEGCYDNAEAAFSDDEEDLSSRGACNSEGAWVVSAPRGPGGRSGLASVDLAPRLVVLAGLLDGTPGHGALPLFAPEPGCAHMQGATLRAPCTPGVWGCPCGWCLGKWLLS